MHKPGGFQDDLAEMQVEMKNVAKILEATRPKPLLRTVEVSLHETAETPLDAPPKASPARPKKRPPDAASQPAETPSSNRENVTTRLTAETNSLLTEAALRQKLKRASPNTRQDIMETALCEWFKRHGYDRRKRPVEEPGEATQEQPEASREESVENDALSASDG